MKVATTIKEINILIDRVQNNLDKCDRKNQLRLIELIGKRTGLQLAIDIIVRVENEFK